MSGTTGFSRELFLEPVDDDFICSICYGVFCCPVTCEDGHSFCSECITVWQANNSRCPVNRSTLSRPMVRNLAVEGAIGRKVMKCPSTVSLPGGCSWTGTRSSLEDHLPRCDMKVVECPFKSKGCILRAYQRELAQHLLVCPHRTVKCSFCSQEIPHIELLAHSDHCAGKLVSCPNDCGMQIARCKMVSHLAFVCAREARPCPLYSVGCTKVHSIAEADPGSHMKLLMEARVSGACGGSNGNLGDNLLGGSWHIGGDFCLPISSPSFEGHTAAVRLELNKENGISLKLFLESKLALPCFGVSLSCCFRCGVDKVKFNTPASLKCQASVACVEMHNICTEAVFDQMAKNSNPVILDFLLSLSV